MNAANYVVGVIATVLVVVASTVTGISWRRRLLPSATRSLAATSSLVIAVATVVVVAEVLGTIGWFSRWPLVGLTAAVAVASVVFARPVDQVIKAPAVVLQRSWCGAAAAASSALLLAQSLVSIRSNGRAGIYFVDALAYHLPWASHFASTHETTSIVHFTPGGATSYYALNDELLRGVTMALLGRDSLNLLVGPLTVAAVLLAAWAVGSVVGRGAVALCVLAPLVASFGYIIAGGVNDWSAIWPVVAALAILLHLSRSDVDGRGRPAGATGGMVIIGLALGLAAGAKFSLLAPVVLVAVGIVVVARDRRLLTAGMLAGGALLTGGYWFVRNTVDTGSPLPTAHLPLFPHVPMSTIDKYGFSVAHYLTDGHVISAFLSPGLRAAFGPLWPVLLALVAAGVVTALTRQDPVARMVAAVVVVGLIAYVVTPTTALGPEGQPVLFSANTRYAWPVLALGLLLLVLEDRWRWWPTVVTALAMAVLVGQLTRDTSWGADTSRRVVVVAVAISLLAAAVVTVLRSSQPRIAIPAVVGVLIVALMVGGYPLQRYYLDHRYHSDRNASQAFIAFMQRYQDTSIGVVGVRELYPLEGVQWTNDVQYVGDLGSNHSFEDYRTCTDLTTAVQGGGYQVVAVGLAVAGRITGAQDWIANDPAAHQVFSNPAAVVFEIDSGFGAATC